MAKQTKKSGLLASLGTEGRKGFDAHKADETSFGGGGDLPPGIEGGIAQLIDCRFGIYKSGAHEGEYFFLAAGIVKEPKAFGNQRIEGLRTQITEPMCNTPEREGDRARRTIEDHWEWVLNELRKLGIDTVELDEESIEDVVAVLKEERPHFRFRTYQWEIGGRSGTKEEWRGQCEYVEDESDEVVDETEDETEDEEASVEEAGVEEDTEDLMALGKAADRGDGEAEKKLGELAEKAGIDAESYETWVDVAEALEGGEEEQEEGEEDFEPEKGKVYLFKPPKARKAVECELTALYPGKQTCNLKNLDTGNSYKGVPWDKLEEEEED